MKITSTNLRSIVTIGLLTLTLIWCTTWLVRQVTAIENGQSSKLTLAQAKATNYIFSFPSLARDSIIELNARFSSDPIPLLKKKIDIENIHWVRHFPEKSDPGYLLFSGIDPEEKKTTIKLIKISNGEILAKWNPDWELIYKKLTIKNFQEPDYKRARALHPLLLKNGDIVFNTLVAMVRMNTCTSVPVWILDKWVDHSTEIDTDGTIWSQSTSNNSFPENSWLNNHLTDNTLLHITPEGKILEEISFSKKIIANGLKALLFGTSNASQKLDPIHINEIQVAFLESKYWKKGDLLISSRNLSTIFLYRPKTGKIIWHRTGPWMNQHSAAFVDNHTISVFSNNIISGLPENNNFLNEKDTNEVIIYDFNTDKYSQPYSDLLAIARPVTSSQGRAQILKDGGLFIEETDYGRDIRFTKDKLLWSRINDYDKNNIGNVGWSRYLTTEEISGPMDAIRTKKCNITIH